MSTEATIAPGPVSAPTAENLDPSTRSSADLGALMRAAALIQGNAAKAEPTPDPAKPDETAGKPGPTAEEKAATDKAAADKAATDKAAADAAAKKEAEEKGEVPDKFRPRLSNEEDVAIALLAKQKGITLRAAAKLYESDAGPAKVETAPQVDPVADHDKAIKAATDELAATRAALKKATEDMDGDKVAELTEKFTDQKLAIRDLEAAKKSTIQERESAADQQQASVEHQDYQKVLARYPDLAPPAKGEQPSATRQKFNDFVAKRQNDGDLFVREGDKLIPLVNGWRSILAREFAEENNLSPAKAKEATPLTPTSEKKTEVPPPAKQPRTAPAATVLTTGDAPESGSTFEATPQDVERAIAEGKFSSKQLGQLMRQVHTLKKAS